MVNFPKINISCLGAQNGFVDLTVLQTVKTNASHLDLLALPQSKIVGRLSITEAPISKIKWTIIMMRLLAHASNKIQVR